MKFSSVSNELIPKSENIIEGEPFLFKKINHPSEFIDVQDTVNKSDKEKSNRPSILRTYSRLTQFRGGETT